MVLLENYLIISGSFIQSVNPNPESLSFSFSLCMLAVHWNNKVAGKFKYSIINLHFQHRNRETEQTRLKH